MGFSYHDEVIEAFLLHCLNESFNKCVGVRGPKSGFGYCSIRRGKVAVVTLRTDTDQKEYSLFYFGVSEDGNSLVDLESMDWALHRCPTTAD